MPLTAPRQRLAATARPRQALCSAMALTLASDMLIANDSPQQDRTAGGGLCFTRAKTA